MGDTFLYSKDGPRLFKEGEELPTEMDGWYDHPEKVPPEAQSVTAATKALGSAIAAKLKK